MTNPDYTHAVLVVDRSGSMSDVKDEAQGGINAFLKDQYALDGKLTTTLVQFDTEIETVMRMSTEPISYVLEPRGMTALLDAVGSEIHRTGADLSKLDEDERPGRVLFVIVTDGAENSSNEYNLETVRSLVEHQRDVYNWVFQFIGAGEAAWQGHEMGMAASQYVQSAKGNRSAYASLNAATIGYRSAPIAGASFAMPDIIEEDTADTLGFNSDPAVKPTKKPAAKKAGVAKKAPASKKIASS